VNTIPFNKEVNANIVTKYGLKKGKVSNNILDPDLDVYIYLCFFFDEIQALAKPRATILVYRLTNNRVQDDKDTLDLPAWTWQKETCIIDGASSSGWNIWTSDLGS
jgi:hypothetical protein